MNVDPLKDEFPSWSSYNYVGNNPLSVIDPDGMGWYKTCTGSSADANGNSTTTCTYTWNDEVNSQSDLDNQGIVGTFIDFGGKDTYEYRDKEGILVSLEANGPTSGSAGWHYATPEVQESFLIPPPASPISRPVSTPNTPESPKTFSPVVSLLSRIATILGVIWYTSPELGVGSDRPSTLILPPTENPYVIENGKKRTPSNEDDEADEIIPKSKRDKANEGGGARKKPGKRGKMNQDGRENKQAKQAADAEGLDIEQRNILHQYIQGEDFNYHQLREIARGIKNGEIQ